MSRPRSIVKWCTFSTLRNNTFIGKKNLAARKYPYYEGNESNYDSSCVCLKPDRVTYHCKAFSYLSVVSPPSATLRKWMLHTNSFTKILAGGQLPSLSSSASQAPVSLPCFSFSCLNAPCSFCLPDLYLHQQQMEI